MIKLVDTKLGDRAAVVFGEINRIVENFNQLQDWRMYSNEVFIMLCVHHAVCSRLMITQHDEHLVNEIVS